MRRWWLILAGVLLGAAVLFVFFDEQRDTRRLREATTRICARDNRERADRHAEDPVGAPRRNRREAMLPILFCEPNLRGRPARARPVYLQRRFVCLYQHHQLAPLPSPGQVRGREPDPHRLCTT